LECAPEPRFAPYTAAGLFASREIARRMDIPEQFLGKIALQLARAGVIEIVQGAKGGRHGVCCLIINVTEG
jgi:DNA-binding IscR family transcriptional regulator